MLTAWKELKRVLKKYAPQKLKSLNMGATDKDLKKLEDVIGRRLPKQFIESYSLHDGQTIIGFNEMIWEAEELLTIDRIIEEWHIWRGLLDSGGLADMRSEPEKGIKDDWWNPLWIPITANGLGDSYCIDLDPAPGGRAGQIIRMDHADPARELVARSLKDLLLLWADVGDQITWSQPYPERAEVYRSIIVKSAESPNDKHRRWINS